MSAADPPRVHATAAALRREFDESFARPARHAADDVESVLALRVGGDAYAVRLADVTGLLADRKLVPLPTAVPEFLGVVGMRGGVVPTWSLGALLGYGVERESPRWLILVGERGGARALALAFERFEGHVRVPRAQLTERPVLAVDAIINDIQRRLGHEDATKTR